MDWWTRASSSCSSTCRTGNRAEDGGLSHAGTAGDIGHLTVMTQWPEASRTFGFSDVSQGGLESCLVVAVTILVDVAPQEPHLYAREVRKRFHKGCQGALVRALPRGGLSLS